MVGRPSQGEEEAPLRALKADFDALGAPGELWCEIWKLRKLFKKVSGRKSWDDFVKPCKDLTSPLGEVIETAFDKEHAMLVEDMANEEDGVSFNSDEDGRHWTPTAIRMLWDDA